MNDLDIYVHASLGETLSIAIMQAMAWGKAAITKDVDSINKMISYNKTGLLVPPINKKAMADATEKLISNNNLELKLGSAAWLMQNKIF